MKRKVFLQDHPFIYIISLIFLGVAATSIVGLILIIFSDEDFPIIWRIIAIIGGLYFSSAPLYYTIVLLFRAIIFTETEIYVPQQLAEKNYRKQYTAHVPYVKIKSIYAEYSEKNSLNEKFNHGDKYTYNLIKMQYIVFILDDGSEKRINVMFNTYRQIKKIVDLAVERAKILGNDCELASGEEIASALKELEKKDLRAVFGKRKKNNNDNDDDEGTF